MADDASPTEGGSDVSELLDVTYDEQFYPARPRALRPRARRKAQVTPETPLPFAADARNMAYVRWLEDLSMLHDANVLGRQLSGQAEMWANSYAHPDPRAAVDRASVWFTAYPLSLITAPGQSFLGALGDQELWDAFEKIGIEAIHTGPVKRAGGLTGWEYTPSVDGHFDRISMAIDPVFGTEEEFREMCEVATAHGGLVIDDVIPGHTGKGADFRLAEMNYKDYPGIYHMINIPEADWQLLPDVPEGQDSVNISAEVEHDLQEAGYIIGELQRVIFFEKGLKETNWSVTAPVLDTEGTLRRWVYLHYFKAGQPSINWLDPTFSGMRLVMGDAMHSLLDLGSGALRLDANGFLGVERSVAGSPAWSEGHPVSEVANQLLGSMVRKVGGFTFQELNLSIEDIRSTSVAGPDLSYDFVTRPGYQHALLTGDTEFLRLTLAEAMRIGIDQASLVHALQNHDELTYELVHFASRHANDQYQLGEQRFTGSELAEHIRESLREALTGEAAPYNLIFTTNGIACTTATVIAAALHIENPIEATEEEVRRIAQAHLLLAMYNAWQPGVFALSGWDLTGCVTLQQSEVRTLIAAGDTRWIERGAHDLMGLNPEAVKSSSGMPRARSLYGTLPDQLADPSSFARQLSRILAVRAEHGIARAQLVEVPATDSPSLLVLVNMLQSGDIEVTLLNFSAVPLSTNVRSQTFKPDSRVIDLLTGMDLGSVHEDLSLDVQLEGFEGRACLLRSP
jgi:trehalose synthase